MDENKKTRGETERGESENIKPGVREQNRSGGGEGRPERQNNRFKRNRDRGGRPREAADKNGSELSAEENGASDHSAQGRTARPGQKRADKPVKQNNQPRAENNGEQRGERRGGKPQSPTQPNPQQDKRAGGGIPAKLGAGEAQVKSEPRKNIENRQNSAKQADQNRRRRSGRPSDEAPREPKNVIDDDASVYLPEFLRKSPVVIKAEPEPEPESEPGVFFFPDDTAQVVFGDAPVEKPEEEPAEPVETVEIVDVRFKLSGKTYFFAPNGLSLAKDQSVIVETARGVEFGTVVQANRRVPLRDIVPPLKNVLRPATEEDKARRAANEEREIDAFNICLEKIEEHKLDMKLVEVEYTFDNSKLLFYFSSDGRVDFRELARDLASIFKTRIELRQIGIRDEAKMMGGLGICGRALCCSTFLNDFGQVSIKMAKEQSLSLNSAKISGTCGRLMCCLRYEYGTYAEEIAKTPRVDSVVETPDGTGSVIEISPLAGLVKVRLFDDPDQPPRLYHRNDLKQLARRQPEKSDAPRGSDASDADASDADASDSGDSGASPSEPGESEFQTENKEDNQSTIDVNNP